ncbi:ferredoxin [candidate division LCP-89 bacterium B3_LCP]|uniref:Ferredoxin n=1 Tax=candidate division LCP-89 bacterium B3_LCP TaxID=2012998 RepID=A0A532V4H3_UNCL8|nr:MAG: ferredoxin [candidate division LCP-89 bacterium B3_LCP]
MSDFKVKFLPAEVSIEADEGVSLLEVARRAGYVMQSECGGQGTCRRCKVKLVSGDVFLTGEPNISSAEREQNLTLACLARIVEDIIIEVPDESELTFAKDEFKPQWLPGEHPGDELHTFALKVDPLLQCLSITVPKATLQNNSSDFDRLCSTLEREGCKRPFKADISILKGLSSALREDNGFLNVQTVRIGNTTEICSLDTTEERPLYGLALDIGTTTVFGRLIDLSSGEVAAESSEYNRQIPCGGDIIHRIIYAGNEKGLNELNQLVLDTIGSIFGNLISEVDATEDQVVASVVAGNATMEHLFLGMNPKSIREDPYVPTVTEFPLLQAGDVNMPQMPHSAPMFLSPAVASYVGGDITAGLLAAGIHKSDQLTLYIDLGTNGEVVLGNREWLTACACSAGPAFEGSGVRCGMRALPGSIDAVVRDLDSGGLTYNVIGGGTPRGICGSGLIDLLAELHATEIVDARGKLQQEKDGRIRKANRKAEMVLFDKVQTGGAEDIVITDVDLDNLVRTKGAIFAGIMTLLKGVGLQASEIERVVIAGGFGRTLNIENAIRIGMLPDLPRDRFEYIGNGSLRGAGLALLSRKMWGELHQIAKMITYFELSTWPGYMDEYMAALFLPHTDAALFPSVL